MTNAAKLFSAITDAHNLDALRKHLKRTSTTNEYKSFLPTLRHATTLNTRHIAKLKLKQ